MSECNELSVTVRGVIFVIGRMCEVTPDDIPSLFIKSFERSFHRKEGNNMP